MDLWDQETFQDNLQLEHRYTNGGAAAEIVAILEEAREGREERKRYIGTIFCSFQVLYHLRQPSFFAQAAGERAEKQSEQGEVHLGKFSSYNFVKNPPT